MIQTNIHFLQHQTVLASTSNLNQSELNQKEPLIFFQTQAVCKHASRFLIDSSVQTHALFRDAILMIMLSI